MYRFIQTSSATLASNEWVPFSAVFSKYRSSSDFEDDIPDLFDFLSSDSYTPDEDDHIKTVASKEAYCFNTGRFAEKIVDAILTEAVRRVRRTLKQKLSTTAIVSSLLRRQSTRRDTKFLNEISKFLGRRTASSHAGSFNWPRISEFNIKLGEQKLDLFITNWERSDDWKYYIDFLGFESEDCSNIFVYEVEWSKPTCAYPIPQATASVFFGLEVSKIVPNHYDRSVDVSYVFECSNFIHHPGINEFQEKWLEDIINAKLKFFKRVTFSVPEGVCEPDDWQGQQN